MGYRDIYKESNEQAEERFSLVMERFAEIAEETDVPEKFDDFFKKTAAFLLQLKNVSEKAEKDTLKDASLTECEKQNAGFYDDIKAEIYGKSYGNPTYAVEKLGEEYGQILSALYAECRKRITDAYADHTDKDNADHPDLISSRSDIRNLLRNPQVHAQNLR